MRHRPRALATLTLALAAPLARGAALPGLDLPEFDVSVTVTGLRSARGQVLACLTSAAHTFPDCARDPHARARIVPAGPTVQLDFGPVPEGRYAIAIVHDENGNGRLDKRMMLPSEGYGFSRDAPLRFGPPSFDSAAFEVDAPLQHQSIRMRYLF